MRCLLGYCLAHRCSNFPMWDEEKQKMVCNAYHNGIPESMWERVEAGKNCLWLNKDRLSIEELKVRKKLEQIKKMNLSDEDALKEYEKFDEWFKKNFMKD